MPCRSGGRQTEQTHHAFIADGSGDLSTHFMCKYNRQQMFALSLDQPNLLVSCDVMGGGERRVTHKDVPLARQRVVGKTRTGTIHALKCLNVR